MTTVEDTQEISASVDVTPSGVIHQETEIVNPTSIPSSIVPTPSHDHETNDIRMENIESLSKKWRFSNNYLIETSTTGLVGYLHANFARYYSITNIGNPINDRAANCNDTAYAGVRFDIEFKFTIYSSSQQQGALIFHFWPGMTYSGTNPMDSCFEFLNGPVIGDEATLDYSDIDIATQLPYKIVSFGGETEVIMTIPFSMKYDFIQPRIFPQDMSWGTIMVSIFDPLVVKSGTYDKVSIRVEHRLNNLQLVGPNFRQGITNMGTYGGSLNG